MVERQDIDALLISALYGELTPSEETRLAAHLDSHPADKTALADLTHARGLVRESRLFQIQLEPPASVSALLMKEATRCAPKPQVSEGWFARFVRSFAAHPAMAAAAMLVVVLGVATLVTRRSGDQFVESSAPATSQVAIQESQDRSGADSPSSGVAMGSGSAAQSDNYRVALDEGIGAGKDDLAKEQPNDQLNGQAEGLADKKSAEKPKRESVTVTKAMADGDFGGKLTKQDPRPEPKAAKKAPQQGIELRAPQASPKDFEDDARPKGKAAASKNQLAISGDSDGTVDRRFNSESAPGAGASGGASGAASPGITTGRAQEPTAPSPVPTITATATRPSAPTTPRANNNASPPPPPAAAKPEPRRDAPAPAPAKTADRNATARAAGPAEEKPADSQLAWARDQHAALIGQVRAGDCKKAAGIATAISNRAPAYYQQNVETDRAVKACIAYINSERERDAEQRSERARANQKRSVNEPAKAAPPSKPTATGATK